MTLNINLKFVIKSDREIMSSKMELIMYAIIRLNCAAENEANEMENENCNTTPEYCVALVQYYR